MMKRNYLFYFLILGTVYFPMALAADELKKELPDEKKVLDTSNAPVKKPLKKIVDKDGDGVVVLDIELRNKLHETKQLKENSLLDSPEDIERLKKEFEKNVLTKKDVKYDFYTTSAGDQLTGISQKLYGTTIKWREIQLLNEAQLKGVDVEPGSKLKYVIYSEQEIKEMQNGGEKREDSNSKN